MFYNLRVYISVCDSLKFIMENVIPALDVQSFQHCLSNGTLLRRRYGYWHNSGTTLEKKSITFWLDLKPTQQDKILVWFHSQKPGIGWVLALEEHLILNEHSNKLTYWQFMAAGRWSIRCIWDLVLRSYLWSNRLSSNHTHKNSIKWTRWINKKKHEIGSGK